MTLSKISKIVPILILLCILISGLIPSPAAATPPSSVDLSYDKERKELSVSVTHDSLTPTSHYIRQIEIKRAGTLLNSSIYSSQPDKHRFTYTYKVDAANGDILEATAKCNVFGQMSSTLNVTTGKTTSKGGSSYSLWPFHASLMVVGSILCAVGISSVYMKKRPWWLKGHKIVGMIGGGLMIIGVGIAAYMISSSGGTHLRVPHAWVGLTTISVLIALLSLAMVYTYFNKLKRKVRKPHLWLGRGAMILMAVNIVLGIILVGLITFG